MNRRPCCMACGHNCWGILWAPVTGKIVSELVASEGESSFVDIAVRPNSQFIGPNRTQYAVIYVVPTKL